ncbi:MAG: VWA domain-containing protein [Candidatus Solibacter usitatus]|nr:VWA domain-containing protein [Candidatus Solibacter usitatus]
MYTRRHPSLGILALAFCAGASAVSAQAPPSRAQAMKSEEAFKSSVAEVIVPVTITDEKGRFVRDLEAKDFELFDEGKPQTITYFTRERNQPVVIGFLVDLSNTNRLHWDKFKEAIQDLTLATLEPDGKPDSRFSGYMIGYSTEAELMVNTTADPEKILDRIRRIKPGGGAALFDAIYMACASRTLVKGEPIEPRRVIVIVGDGHDNSSKKTLDEVVEIAQRNLVTIYGVSTTAFGFANPGEPILKRLAESTGGRVVYPLENVYSDVSGYLSTPSDEGNFALKVGTGGYAAAIMRGIVSAIAATAGEITTQYILRYTPSNTDVAKTFRRIEVKVKLGNVRVRAREGYYPFAP